MKTIIAGPRDETIHEAVWAAMEQCGWEVTEVISGGANGVDKLGEEWAQAHEIPVRRFVPDWSSGPKAGPMRNMKMVDEADALVVVRLKGRNTPGTAHVLKRAKQKGLRVYVHEHENGVH